jgi:hypothetical protein
MGREWVVRMVVVCESSCDKCYHKVMSDLLHSP